MTGLAAGMVTFAWPDAMGFGVRLIASLLSAMVAGFGYKLGVWLWRRTPMGENSLRPPR